MMGAEVWWRDWLDHRDLSARDRLFVHYCPMTEFIAERVGGELPALDRRDLVTAGLFALIDGLERFDLSKEATFEMFVVPRIHRAIVDRIRSWKRASLSERRRTREIEVAFSELDSVPDQVWTDEDFASQLRVDAPQFRRWLASIASTVVGPYDRAFTAAVEPLARRGQTSGLDAERAEEREVWRLVHQQVRRLPEREQFVLLLHYETGFRFADIAHILCGTERSVSRTHTKGVRHLRARLLRVAGLAEHL